MKYSWNILIEFIDVFKTTISHLFLLKFNISEFRRKTHATTKSLKINLQIEIRHLNETIVHNYREHPLKHEAIFPFIIEKSIFVHRLNKSNYLEALIKPGSKIEEAQYQVDLIKTQRLMERTRCYVESIILDAAWFWSKKFEESKNDISPIFEIKKNLKKNSSRSI